MKRKSGGRSYLQQLAQPVLPGATVLTARPVSTAYAAETTPQMPLIEDTFNMPDDAQIAPAHDSARPHRPSQRQQPSIEATERLPQSEAITESPASESPRIATHRPNPPGASAQPGVTTTRPAQHIKAPPASVPSARVRSSHEAHSLEPPARANAHKVLPDRSEPVTKRIAQSLQNEEGARSEKHTAHSRIERVNTAPAAHESAQEPIASSKAPGNAPSTPLVAQDYITKRKEIQQAREAAAAPISAQAAAKQKAETPVVRSTEGPRVHIGTVEIRAVLPQPAVPQAVTMAPNVAQNNAVAQARGRSGAAEPLARGLDWSYGLVQG
jgi:hypothetical protein